MRSSLKNQTAIAAILLIVCSSLGIISCGKSSDGKREPTPRQDQNLQLLTNLEDYFVDDLACQSDSNAHQINRSSILLRTANESERVTVEGHLNLKSLDKTSNDFINNMIYNEEYTIHCDEPDLDCFSFSHQWKVTQPGLSLRICSEDFPYPRNSYENIALTSAYLLTKAQKKAKEVVPDITFPKIEVHLLPRFIRNIERISPTSGPVQHIATNNLFYLNATPPSIFILPDEEETGELSLNAGRYLWESGFVLGHEFGHYLSRLISPNALDDLYRRTDVITFLPTLKPHYYNPLSANQKSNLRKLVDAVSEGFADLVGFYSEDRNSDSIVGIPCFSETRNVDDDFFKLTSSEDPDSAVNELKTLSLDRLRKFLGETSSTRPQVLPCDLSQVDDTDEYILGAILANFFESAVVRYSRQLNSSFPNASETQNALHYRLALAWFELIVDKLWRIDDFDITPEIILQVFVDSMVVTIQNDIYEQGYAENSEFLLAMEKRLCALVKIRTLNAAQCSLN